MTEHIVINLDKPLFVPTAEMTLLNMVLSGDFTWPTGATCVTQECDGELLWWSAPIGEVKEARNKAEPETGLMPFVGLGSQVHADYFLLKGQEVVAQDWKESVVTIDDFTTNNS